mgnify:FL=1
MSVSKEQKFELYKLAVEMVERETKGMPGIYVVGKDDWKLSVEQKFDVLCSHFEEIKAKDQRGSKKVEVPRFIKA